MKDRIAVRFVIGDRDYAFCGWFDPGAEESFCLLFNKRFAGVAKAEVESAALPEGIPNMWIGNVHTLDGLLGSLDEKEASQ